MQNSDAKLKRGAIIKAPDGRHEIIHKAIFLFPRGIIGFEKVREFMAVPNKRMRPFVFMQSVTSPSFGFVCLNPFLVRPDYEIKLGSEVAAMLRMEEEAKMSALAVVTVRDKPASMTMNLLSPIVLNCAAGLGAQIVLDNSSFSVSQNILESIDAPAFAAVG